MGILSNRPVSAPGKSLGQATALLSAATLLSRILGLCREQAFAALLGARYFGDAFTLAFRLPNLLRDLFAEGALSAAFQPAFLQRLRQGGREEAYRLANLVATTLLCVVGLLTVLGIVFAPAMVESYGKGFEALPGKAELTVLLTRIMMPFLLLVSLAAVAMGILNAEERFLWPALAPALFNLAAIGTGAGLWLFGVRHSRGAAVGWAVATLAGGALQLLVQLPALLRSGYRFAPRLDLRFRDPGLRQVLLTMAPATAGLMATQVNIFISTRFASAEDGAATWLNCAFRLLQLPIGMFGVAVGTVALSRFSRSAAEAQPDLESVRDTLRRGLRMVAFLTAPTAVGMVLLAEPLVAVIYQHGAFRAQDTLATAAALRYYCAGLLCYSAVKVVAPVFYVLKLARVPVAASVLAVAANVIFNVALHGAYGYRILALGTSIAAIANVLVLLVVFQRRYGGLLREDLLLPLLRIALAALLMGGVLEALGGAARWLLPAPGFGGALAELALSAVAGAATYGALCRLMKLEEMTSLWEQARRRLRRR